MFPRCLGPIRISIKLIKTACNMFNHPRIKAYRGMLLNPVDQPTIQHILRHFRFEFRIADEDDHGQKMIFGEIEELHECFDV